VEDLDFRLQKKQYGHLGIWEGEDWNSSIGYYAKIKILPYSHSNPEPEIISENKKQPSKEPYYLSLKNFSPEEIRCTRSETTHFVEFIPSQSSAPKLLIYPLDNQRAVVVEAINTDFIAQEKNGNIVFCNESSLCQPYKSSGLLAYTVDVSKLSSLGVIMVPEALKFPNLLVEGKEISIGAVLIKNLGCDTRGCFVSIGS
jgi:hypothetical protein